MLFYAISDRSLDKNSSLYLQLKKYISLGVNWILIREKDLNDKQIYLNVLRIAPYAREKNIKLFVSGRADIAYLSGADGVHLPSDSILVSEVKKKFKKLIVVKSCHSVGEIKRAEKEGADAVTLSPIFEPQSKKGLLKPAGIEYLIKAIATSKIPVIALGGISEKNILSVSRTGVYGIAAVNFFNEIDRRKFHKIKEIVKEGRINEKK